MITRTRLTSFIVLALLFPIVSACKSRIVTGSEQTFAIDVPRSETGIATNVTLDMAIPQGDSSPSG